MDRKVFIADTGSALEVWLQVYFLFREEGQTATIKEC